MKKRNLILIAMLFLIFVNLVIAEEVTMCCEKTKKGFYCQDAPAQECDTGYNPRTSQQYRAVPTSCNSVSYCKPGYCYDSIEGTCLDNTPQEVCNANGGIWSAEFPKQCELGCCILGDQAAFVSLVRCKRLSAFLGLNTNYKKEINDEVSCVYEVQKQDKGACVYEYEFERTCKFTTRDECTKGVNGTGIKGEFFKNKLCSAEELGTICGPTKKTTCVPGKDEVYFVDSCGNPANIYDASKVDDKEYWTNVKSKNEVCGANRVDGNALSRSCGNCDYIAGSFCRKVEPKGTKPVYGDYMCADLNCKKVQNGKSYRHGESWCVYNDYGSTGKGESSVGSRFYKHICINGEEVLEQCADFRQQECIEDSIVTPQGTKFSQAACRANRWIDCLNQLDKLDCENSDKRDCYWKDFIFSKFAENESITGVCLPKNPPGLRFWEGEEAKNICALGNDFCIVEFEKGHLDSDWKCVKNCECLEKEWEEEHTEICSGLGDCGPKVNWIGETGYRPSYNVSIEKYKREEK